VSGYFNNPELTKRRIRDGWFYTGEIGQWNPNGTLTVFGHKEELLEPKNGEFVLYPA
jgi:long-subunit acyl-CoA synthetase (AMP-forming)